MLPIQIYNWITPVAGGVPRARAAAIVVLLAILLLMNSVAIFIRNRFQKRW